MVGTALTLEINATPVDVDNIAVTWSDDPSKIWSWKAVLSDISTSVSTQDAVNIKKGGTSIFKGIVEQIEPSFGAQTTKKIGGRHTKVKLWRKWHERYETSGGYWGGFYPDEIIKFLLNPSISEFPDGNKYDRRIGWGLESTGWTATAVAYEQDEDEKYTPAAGINKYVSNGWHRGIDDGQNFNDWYKIDLNENRDITALVIKNEMITSADRASFPRNYKIEISPNDSDWYQVASKSGNEAMNIVHSWNHDALSSFYQDVQYVKITITSTYADADWRIGDMYLFESTGQINGISQGTITAHDPLNVAQLTSTVSSGSDIVIAVDDGTKFNDLDYCLLWDTNGEEIVYIKVEGVNGNNVTVQSVVGTYLSSGTLTNLTSTGGFNLSYDRRSNSIHKITQMLKDSNGNPWEWEVTDNGVVNVGERVGTDKSGSISFSYAINIIKADRKDDDKAKVDRVLVLGGSKGIEQDVLSSGWIGTGDYETVVTDKSIKSKQAAINRANLVLTEQDQPTRAVVQVYDDYAANTWDVGDDITLTHSGAGLSGSYRAKNVVRSWSMSGEIVTITCEDNTPDIDDVFGTIGGKLLDDDTESGNLTDHFNDMIISKDGYMYIWEAESLPLDSDATIVEDVESSAYAHVQMGAVSGHVLQGPGFTLVPGTYNAVFYMKVSDNTGTNDLVTLEVRSEFGGVLETLTIKPTKFTASDTWEHIYYTFEAVDILRDVEFRIYNKVAASGTLSIDWVGIQSSTILDIPAGPPDVSGVTVVATGVSLGINIEWTEVTDLDLDHYILYRDTTTAPTTEYARVRTNNYADNNVSVGITYYYRIKAVDWAENESDYSSEDSAEPLQVDGSTDILPDTIGADLIKRGIQPFQSTVVVRPIYFFSTTDSTYVTIGDNSTDCTLTISSGVWGDHGILDGDDVIIRKTYIPDNAGTYNSVDISGAVMTLTGYGLWDTDLDGTPAVDDRTMGIIVRDGIIWSSGSIAFADGSATLTINSGNAHGVSNGVRYLYFTVGSSTLQIATDFAVTVSNTTGVLAEFQIYNVNDEVPWIVTHNSKFPSLQAESIIGTSITGYHLSGEWVVGGRFATKTRFDPDFSYAGVEMDYIGIRGYSDASTIEFQISALDGTGIFGGGAGIIDSSGLTVTDDGTTATPGGLIKFKNSGGTEIGTITVLTDIPGGVDTLALIAHTNYNAVVYAYPTESTYIIGGDVSIAANQTSNAGNVTISASQGIQLVPDSSSSISIQGHINPTGTSWNMGTPTTRFATGFFTDLFWGNQTGPAERYVKDKTDFTLLNKIGGVSPTADSHFATKGYVDGVAGAGVTWLEPILSFENLTTNYGTPSTGDRHINLTTGTAYHGGGVVTKDYVYEWNGSIWTTPDGSPPVSGWTVYNNDDSKTWQYRTSPIAGWITIISAGQHDNLSGISVTTEGLGLLEYYHLSSAEATKAASFADQTGTVNYFLVGDGSNFVSTTPLLSGTALGLGGAAYYDVGSGLEDDGAGNLRVDASNIDTGVLGRAYGGTGEDLSTVPGYNALIYYDEDIGNQVEWLIFDSVFSFTTGTYDELGIKSATQSQRGVAEIASSTEIGAQTSDSVIITPFGLQSIQVLDALVEVSSSPGITTGAWSASPITVPYGGLGRTTIAANQLIRGNATSNGYDIILAPSDGTMLVYTTLSGFEWTSTLISHDHYPDEIIYKAGAFLEPNIGGLGVNASLFSSGSFAIYDAAVNNNFIEFQIGSDDDILTVSSGTVTWRDASFIDHDTDISGVTTSTAHDNYLRSDTNDNVASSVTYTFLGTSNTELYVSTNDFHIDTQGWVIFGVTDVGAYGGRLDLTGSGASSGGELKLSVGASYDTSNDYWAFTTSGEDLIIYNAEQGIGSPFITFDADGLEVDFEGKHIYSGGANLGYLSTNQFLSLYLSGSIYFDGVEFIDGTNVDGIDVSAHDHRGSGAYGTQINLAGANIGVTGTLGAASGGTGWTTYSQGEILYGNISNGLDKLAFGANSNIMQLNAGIPSWVALSTIDHQDLDLSNALDLHVDHTNIDIIVGTGMTGGGTIDSNVNIGLGATIVQTDNVNWFTVNQRMSDGKAWQFNEGTWDVQLYFDAGTNSLIVDLTDTHIFKIMKGGPAGETLASFVEDAAVTLYYNGTWALATTISGGVNINDNLTVGGTVNSITMSDVTLNTDTDVSGNTWVLDEDAMGSNSPTKVATQQSIKAYVSSQVLAYSEISELEDVLITTLGAGEVLQSYDVGGGTMNWRNRTPTEASLSIIGHTHSGAQITSGAVGAAYGGTNANLSGVSTGAMFRWTGSAFGTLAPVGTGSIIYSSSATAWDVRLAGNNTNVLTMTGGVPVWQSPSAGSFSTLTDTPSAPWTTDRMVYASDTTHLAFTSYDKDDVFLRTGSVVMTGDLDANGNNIDNVTAIDVNYIGAYGIAWISIRDASDNGRFLFNDLASASANWSFRPSADGEGLLGDGTTAWKHLYVEDIDVDDIVVDNELVIPLNAPASPANGSIWVV